MFLSVFKVVSDMSLILTLVSTCVSCYNEEGEKNISEKSEMTICA